MIDSQLLSPQFPKMLALDFGTERVGVAVSYGSLAEPLEILPQDDQVFTKIQQLIIEHRPERVVVGISEGKMAEKTHQFAEKLQKLIELPIVFADETLSSWSTTKKLTERDAAKRKYKGPIDHFAAASFLQEYLDTYMDK